MDELFRLLPGPQPIWLRYGATIAMVLASFILRLGLEDRTGEYGFILFIPAIVAAGLLFDRGSGFLAVILSTLLISSIVEWEPAHPEYRLPGLLTFLVVGLGLVFVSEALHKALARAFDAEREKDVLLQEMSHRVKNKFTLITSIIGLQSRGAPPEMQGALNAIAGRVRVISDVHNYLQLSRHDGSIEMVEYLEGLCRSLSEAVGELRPITLSVKVDRLELDNRRALAVGLIVNELVTNAFKYAFPEERAGSVLVQLKSDNGNLVLCVADDGVGCGDDVQANLGTKLVSALAAQLGGEVKRESANPGCRSMITFPRKEGSL